jgi:O-antigen/teichoic acid export membrane protein
MNSLLNNMKLSGFTFLSRIISGSIVYIILARLMSVNDFGLLTFGTSLAGLLAVVAEFGFSLMAQRDIPQNKFNFNEYVFNTFIHKIVFSIVTITGGIIYLNLLYNGENYIVGLIFVFNAIVTSNIMYLFSVFRAKNVFVIESWISMLYAIFSIVIVVFYHYFDLQVLFVAYSLLIVRILQMIILSILLIRKFNIKAVFNLEINKYLFKNSFSFGAHFIIGVFYFSIDNQMLAYFSGNDALAIYQSMFKIVMILLAVNSLFETVFFPYLSSKFGENNLEFLNISNLINKAILILGLTIFLMFNIFIKDIVEFLYSEDYLIGLTIAYPLSLVLLFRIFTTVYSVLLTISNHQNMRVITVAVTLIVNIVLNFIFIPKYGFVGAAWVSAITHIIMFILYVSFAKKYILSFLIDFKTIFLNIVVLFIFTYINFFNIHVGYLESFLMIITYSLFLFGLIVNRDERVQLKRLITGSYY